LPYKTEHPSKKEYDAHSVQLVVYDLGALVNLKDEGVVDLILSKDLNVDSSRYDNEHHYESNDVGFNPR